ncbi:hypothetical protein P8452_01652 [Trifolium repens]|nr:hypothetical protein P8452_01652 [Trifolium repens]
MGSQFSFQRSFCISLVVESTINQHSSLVLSFHNPVNSSVGDVLAVGEGGKGECDISKTVEGCQEALVEGCVEKVMACHVTKCLVLGNQQREGEKSDVGPSQKVSGDTIGPVTCSPLVLRTKNRDIQLVKTFSSSAGVIMGGANSKHVLDIQQGVGPVNLGFVHVIPIDVGGEEREGHAEDPNKSPILNPLKKRKTKKSINHFHPYNKCLNFQDYIQRKGAAMRKKSKKRGGRRVCVESSLESDPIQSSVGEDAISTTRNLQEQRNCASEGIDLLVMLPRHGDVDEVAPVVLSVSSVALIPRRGQDSGVLDLLDEGLVDCDDSPAASRLLVDRETSNAHHIIDIQEDLGLVFPGPEENKIRRLVELENRDRREKQDWEQNQSYQ